MPEEPPRRRITDRDRRRWSDDRLDDLKEDVDELQAEHRAVARVPGELAALSRAFEQYQGATETMLAEMRTDIRELRHENRTAHKRVAHGRDPETAEPLPKQAVTLTWGAVAKIATILAAFFGPTAALVAALLGS